MQQTVTRTGQERHQLGEYQRRHADENVHVVVAVAVVAAAPQRLTNTINVHIVAISLFFFVVLF